MKNPEKHFVDLDTALAVAYIEKDYRDKMPARIAGKSGWLSPLKAIDTWAQRSEIANEGRWAVREALNEIELLDELQSSPQTQALYTQFKANLAGHDEAGLAELDAMMGLSGAQLYEFKPGTHAASIGLSIARLRQAGGNFLARIDGKHYHPEYLDSLHQLLGTRKARGLISREFDASTPAIALPSNIGATVMEYYSPDIQQGGMIGPVAFSNTIPSRVDILVSFGDSEN